MHADTYLLKLQIGDRILGGGGQHTQAWLNRLLKLKIIKPKGGISDSNGIRTHNHLVRK